MKITSVLLIAASLGAHAIGNAQTERVNIKAKNVTTEKVLSTIEKQTDYLFVYNKNEVDLKRKVSINAVNKTTAEVLSSMFDGTDIVYAVEGENIMLMKKENSNEISSISQQKNTIKGTVVDPSGTPIIGANIIVKGSSIGTISDMNGNFSLDAPKGSTIVVSYIGFIDYSIKIGNQKSLEITLKEDSEALDEIVVVGYGVQKKVNLTGAVSTVDSKVLQQRPTSNVTSLLQGHVPGLQIVQNTGQPGAEGLNMKIRGLGSFGAGSAPLVLVDGVSGDLSTLAPSEIESISVLKDASSAAIYGARAANGVILVTTKSGKTGKTQVSYHVNTGWQQATVLPELITNSAEYMEMYNRMADHVPGKVKYSEEYIDKYRDPNRDMNEYPDFDWVHELFKTAFIHNHNVNATGGNDKIKYNLNFSYMNQEGILGNHEYEKFTGRSNIEAQPHEKIKIGTKVAFFNGNKLSPTSQNDMLMLQVCQMRPMYKPYLPDGSGRLSYSDIPSINGGEWVNGNPMYNTTSAGGGIKTENWTWNAQAYIDVNLFKNKIMSLDINTKAALNVNDSFSKTNSRADYTAYYYHKFEGASDYEVGQAYDPHMKTLSDVYSKDKQLTLFATLNYNLNIDKHDFSALFGYNQETFKGRWARATRVRFVSPEITELDGGDIFRQSLGGNSSDWGLASFFGRVNYAYAGKYLAEINFRYDGTSRIYKDNRWGLFPSFSGAWRISEENFIKDNVNWINNLKLRLSWGKLGNQNIGNYVFHDVYGTQKVVLNQTLLTGVSQDALTDKTLKWEETKIVNAGFDANLFDNRLNFSFEWYNKEASGILNRAPMPSSVGLSSPMVNYGKLRNRGVEFEISHQNRINDFSYGINFMATFNKNKVLQLRAPAYGNYIYEEGRPYGEHYIYEWIGLFQSEEEIASSAKHPYKALPGDLKLKDQNGDGIINAKDRIVVPGVHPKMLYSFNINMAYKNFDMVAFFQGVAGRKVYTNDFVAEPFCQGGAPTVAFRDAWTPENRDTNVPALYSGVSYYNSSSNRSTYFLKDASYLRLKNLQIGYNFKQSLISKIGLDFLRIYFSGDNLLTFTDYIDFDPERAGDGRHVYFPQLRTYSIGLDVKF